MEWVPPPPRNIPGANNLSHPLQSSYGRPVPSGLADHLIAGAPIGTVSNRIDLRYSATAFNVELPAGRQASPILQTTFPVPQAAGVLIASDIPSTGQYPLPRRMAFMDRRNDGEGSADPMTGGILVEWGVGPSRSKLWLDLGQHTLQLPITAFVQAAAYAGGRTTGDFYPGAVIAEVGALVMPGHVVAPHATCTTRLYSAGGDGPSSLTDQRVPPFARRFSLEAYANANTIAELTFYDATSLPIAAYRMAVGAAPAAAIPDGAPHGVAVPGGAETFKLTFTPDMLAGEQASVAVVFEVAP
jgi:hypothetical protein